MAPLPRGRAKTIVALYCAAALLLLVRPAAAYSVADCVVTVTSADTGPWGSPTNVIYIDSDAKLAALRDSVDGCAATGGAGGGGGWRVVGGALYIRYADDVVDLEALKDLRAIEGKDSDARLAL